MLHKKIVLQIKMFSGVTLRCCIFLAVTQILIGCAATKGILSIPPAGFTPDKTSADNFYIEADEPSVYMTLLGSDRGCVHASVVFPKEAKQIKRVFVFVRDESASDEAFFKLNRIDYQAGTAATLGFVYTSDSPGVIQYEIPVNQNEISDKYAYELDGCLDPNIRVFGVRIRYE